MNPDTKSQTPWARREDARHVENWKRRVEFHHAQSLGIMDEAHRRADFWKPLAPMFRADPRRTDDQSLDAIAELVESDSTVLDVGGGAGRFAVALSFGRRSVTVVDPSESMLEQLREATSEADRPNVHAIHAQWEDAEVDPADVVLCSHVVYGVADIAPFIEKLSAHARRRVVMLSFVDSPQANASPLWKPVHGERRVDLPALPELVNVLWEMDIYPNVRMLASSPPQMFESVEAATDDIARRMFASGASARARLESVAEDYLDRVDGAYRIRGARPVREGVIWWEV